MESRIHWDCVTHAVNPNFGKNPCFNCVWYYLVNLRSSPLDTCVFGEIVVSVNAGTMWTYSRNSTKPTLHWGLNLYPFTRTRFIAFTPLCVNLEVPVCKIWKFQVHLLPCSNLKVPDLQTWKFWVWQALNFIRCFGVKICRCAYSIPPRRHHGPFNCIFQSFSGTKEITKLVKGGPSHP
jgi:hypothetical protein